MEGHQAGGVDDVGVAVGVDHDAAHAVGRQWTEAIHGLVADCASLHTPKLADDRSVPHSARLNGRSHDR